MKSQYRRWNGVGKNNHLRALALIWSGTFNLWRIYYSLVFTHLEIKLVGSFQDHHMLALISPSLGRMLENSCYFERKMEMANHTQNSTIDVRRTDDSTGGSWHCVSLCDWENRCRD